MVCTSPSDIQEDRTISALYQLINLNASNIRGNVFTSLKPVYITILVRYFLI